MGADGLVIGESTSVQPVLQTVLSSSQEVRRWGTITGVCH